MFLKP